MKESLLRRVLVTVGALLLWEVGRRLWLPIVDGNVVRELLASSSFLDRNEDGAGLCVFALGVSPAVAAFVIVEFAALAWPPWRPLRHDPRGRAALGRAVVVLCVIVSLVQSWLLVGSLERMDGAESVLRATGPVNYLIGVPTLVAGSLVAFTIASAVSRYGLTDGFVLFIGWDGARAVARELAHEGDHTDLVRAAVVVVTIVVIVALTTPLPSARRENAEAPYRGSRRTIECAPWIPTPASSVAPVVIAWNAVGFVAALGMKSPERWAVLRTTWTVPAAIVSMALATVLTFAMNRPSVIADTASRLGISKRSSGRDAAVRGVRRALPATLATIAALFAAGACGFHGVIDAAIAAAVTIDLVRAFRVHATSDLECVWQERRPNLVPQLVAALASVGIAPRVRGASTLALLRIFGPYACAELWVAAADARLARGWLAHWLSSAPAPTEKLARVSAQEESNPRPTLRTVLLSLGAVALAVMAFEYRRPPKNPYASQPRASFVVVRVRDDVDPLADVRDADVPAGIDLYEEEAPVGPGHRKELHFARIPVTGDPEDETKLARDWLATIPVPPGSGFALEEMSDADENGKYSIVALRSFLLDARAIVTEADVTEASVAYERDTSTPYVSLTLSVNGARRFADATEECVERRVAIIVDGKIDSVPIVRARIDGGRLQITRGADADSAHALTEAKRVAWRLAPR